LELKDGWLKKQISATMEQYEQLPRWLKMQDLKSSDEIHSYADV